MNPAAIGAVLFVAGAVACVVVALRVVMRDYERWDRALALLGVMVLCVVGAVFCLGVFVDQQR
jgi:hypothetical protein